MSCKYEIGLKGREVKRERLKKRIEKKDYGQETMKED